MGCTLKYNTATKNYELNPKAVQFSKTPCK